LTVNEVAGFTRLSVGTIQHWVAQGKIPVVRFGSRVLFSPRVIGGWVQEHFCAETAGEWTARIPGAKKTEAAQEAGEAAQEAGEAELCNGEGTK
jgi:excisionase family DNA binding protein